MHKKISRLAALLLTAAFALTLLPLSAFAASSQKMLGISSDSTIALLQNFEQTFTSALGIDPADLDTVIAPLNGDMKNASVWISMDTLGEVLGTAPEAAGLMETLLDPNKLSALNDSLGTNLAIQEVQTDANMGYTTNGKTMHTLNTPEELEQIFKDLAANLGKDGTFDFGSFVLTLEKNLGQPVVAVPALPKPVHSISEPTGDQPA